MAAAAARRHDVALAVAAAVLMVMSEYCGLLLCGIADSQFMDDEPVHLLISRGFRRETIARAYSHCSMSLTPPSVARYDIRYYSK